MKRFLVLLAILLGGLASVEAASVSLPSVTFAGLIHHEGGGGGGGGSTPFSLPSGSVFHYVSPTSSPPSGWSVGNDSNNGLSQSTPWATLNHAMKCGEVIIAAPGTRTSSIVNQNAGAVSSCPSTTGGIDGTGGIYFAILLCGGTDLGSGGCTLDTSGTGGDAFWVNTSNWAIEGFAVKTPPDGSNCFIGNNANTGGTAVHHVAFINNITNQCGDGGFTTSGGGSSLGSFDQTAVVSAAFYNSANSHTSGNECGSGVSIIPANGPDTSAGTHVYLAGLFGSHNTNTGTPGSPGCNVAGGHSDGECIILDTWGAGYTASGYLYQAVIDQTVCWNSGGSSIQIFPQAAAAANDKAQYFILGSTLYAGDQDSTGNGICLADVNFHGISPNSGATTSSLYYMDTSIVLATVNTCGNLGVNPSYAAIMGPELGASLVGKPITVQNNYFWNSAAPTSNVYNTTNNNFYLDTGSGSRSATFIFGTNTYSDPGLSNPAGLPSSAFDCTGYTIVTSCMLTKYNLMSFITPSNAPTTLGYQIPGPCTTKVLSNGTNAFPTWLKGVVVLHWTGSAVVQLSGAITMPCGL